MKQVYLKQSILSLFAIFFGVGLFSQSVCNDFSYFYSDITYPETGKQSDIYSVTLDDGTATLSPIIEDIGFGAHIAYNTINNLIYVVNDANGAISTLDPITGELSDAVQVDMNISGVVTAAFNSEGYLLIGASSDDNIYQVDLSTDPYELSLFSTTTNINGGDITFVGTGADERLIMVTNPSNHLSEVIPGFANPVLGTVTDEPTGMATFEDNESVIISSEDNSQFLVYSTDATEIDAYDIVLDNEPFTMFHGDMASGCSSSSSSIEGCQDFRTYYIHDAQGGGSDILFAVDFNGMGGAMLTQLDEVPAASHLGVGADGLLYIVKHNSGMLTTYDPETFAEISSVQINIDGNNVNNIPAVVVGEDGFVYVGANNDVIYKVDPTTGDATVEGEADVSGGDLIFVDGVLWLANRAQGRFYEVNGAGQFDVAAEDINGVSVLPDGNLLIANGNLNSLFEVYEFGTGDATGETFETGLTLFNGDLASRCFDGQGAEECEDYKFFISGAATDGGGIYSLTLSEGTASVELLRGNQGPTNLAYDESNGLLYLVEPTGNVAIYDPVQDILTTYSNISMGSMNINTTYAAVVTSDGRLLVGSDNQNLIYEVNPATGEASNPIDAPISGGDIVQTPDGDIWVLNRDLDRFYNITDGTDFDVEFNEMYGGALLESGMILAGHLGSTLTVVNPETMMETETTFELPFSIASGDLASGCGDNYIPSEDPSDENGEEAISAAGSAQFITYPNPTEGISNVQVVAGSTERATVEVFDMSGRSVTTLLNQDVQAGNTYRLIFDGTQLPNGVYVVKYVTKSETAIEKIMIAR